MKPPGARGLYHQVFVYTRALAYSGINTRAIAFSTFGLPPTLRSNQVNNHVSKAEGAPGSSGTHGLPEGGPLAAQLAAASALAMVKQKQYKAAARKFASFSGDLGDAGAVGSGGVMAAEDVALYGTLCGLAELDRDEQRSVLLKGDIPI